MIGRVISVHAGSLGRLRHSGREIPSGIVKPALALPAPVGSEGIAGDRHGDPVHHGGLDRALCVYPREHLKWLGRLVGAPPGFAPCGENLSTEGLVEAEVAIGDIFRIGSVVVEVSAPRNPCFLLAARHGVRELPVEMERTGRTGFFFRTLRPGFVTAGDEIVLLERLHHRATIAEANRLMHHDRLDREGLAAMVGIRALASSWRATFRRRLSTGDCGDPSRRRYGD